VATLAALVTMVWWGCGGGDGGDDGMGTGDEVSRLDVEGVTGDTLGLGIGGEQSVAIEAFDSQGREIEDVEITASSSNTAVATVSAPMQTSAIRLATVEFTIQAVGAGLATITFHHEESGTSAALPVRVSGAPGGEEVTILVGNGDRTFARGSSINGTVTVAAGTKVVWDWNDTEPHSTTSDDGLWDSGVRTGDQRFERTFSDPGTFPYFCKVHGEAGGIGMSGTIVVTP
jgi:plastocyanin